MTNTAGILNAHHASAVPLDLFNDQIRTVGQDFAVEAPLLRPVPGEGFDPGLSLEPRVNRSALITVRTAKHSVPARFIGRKCGCRCGHRNWWSSTDRR